MSTSLRRQLMGGFAGAALAAGAAFAPLAAGPALADQAKATGKLLTNDIRNETAFMIEHAPFAASRGRLAVIMYGSDQMILGAVGSAAEHYATKAPGNVDVSFLWAPDNDGNPDTALVGIFANGFRYGTIKIGNARSGQEIARAVYDALGDADRKILQNPQYALAPESATQAPKPAND